MLGQLRQDRVSNCVTLGRSYAVIMMGRRSGNQEIFMVRG